MIHKTTVFIKINMKEHINNIDVVDGKKLQT